MVLKLDATDIEKIYKEYVDAYVLEEMAGTELSSRKSKAQVGMIVYTKKQEYKTKTYGQIAQELVKQDIQRAISGEAVALLAPQIATEENLKIYRESIDLMPDGVDKDYAEEFYNDLNAAREGFNNILSKMKDPMYFKAAIDAIWKMTGNSELVHSMFSPDDGAERGDIFGAMMSALSKK